MPTAPTGQESSRVDPALGDQDEPARRSRQRTTPDSWRAARDERQKTPSRPTHPKDKAN